MSQNNLSLEFENKSDKPGILDGLNEAQCKAVVHQDGPLLIIAGAGTGKTSVITRRIGYIIDNKWAHPSEILALTFTDKAATEMEDRVDKIVPYGFVDTQISTFHAFGDRILRDYSIDLGLPANFKVLSATEQSIFMRENLYAFDLNYYRPIANPLSHISELLNHFSRLKDELIEPVAYLDYAEKNKSAAGSDPDSLAEAEKTLELASAYSRYQELMLQSGNLDYGDQIFLVFKLLSENKAIRQDLTKRFKYILVDEFQDTNYAQYQIIKLLGESHSNITVVGDDDQSIYRFRGASISNIMSFKDDFPGCTQIVLNQNYRSTQEILDASYKLIKHNNPDRLEVQNKIDKRLIATKHGSTPQLLHCDTLSCEADQVASKIKELKETEGLQNKDFAILARANNHLGPFIHALNYLGIPNIYVGSSSLFERPEIKMLVAFFKCLSYNDDNLAFYQLATSELYDISPEKLSDYYAKCRRQNKTYRELYLEAGSTDQELLPIINDIDKFRGLISQQRAGEVLYEYLKEKQYFKLLANATSDNAETKITNIAKFFDRIAQFDHVSDDKSIIAFLENLELILSVGDEVQSSDIDPDLNAVNLMSVHASKGLEWPVVFVVNLVSDRFPGRDRREKIPIPEALINELLPEGNVHLQEERRLFYVAATRAKEHLFITSAEDYGGKKSKKLSQFVLELMDQPDVDKLKLKLSAIEKIERHKPAPKIDQKVHSTINPAEIIKISRQQIDDYYTCPKKYYYASVIKIPLPTNWHFMYGTAIHEAIGRYYARKIRDEKPSLDSIIEDFNQSFTSEGFITREHEEERKRTGIETLSQFYAEDQTINFVPDLIEESFEFSQSGAKISGRYDLVLKTPEGAEICDFKTSSVKSQKDADARIKKSTQMMMYALAWKLKYGIVPRTTLIFIENNLRASHIFSETELEKTSRVISEAAAGIRAQLFEAKAEQFNCSNCSYKDICPDTVN